eukprot:scaffold4924_cov21-Cyclotella_meneghiniana.AAC.2
MARFRLGFSNITNGQVQGVRMVLHHLMASFDDSHHLTTPIIQSLPSFDDLHHSRLPNESHQWMAPISGWLPSVDGSHQWMAPIIQRHHPMASSMASFASSDGII